MSSAQLRRGPWQGRMRWHAFLVVLGVVVPAGWTWWARVRNPSDGTLLAPSPGQPRLRLLKVYQPGSGLRPGDVVRAVDGIGIDDWVAGRAPVVHREIGEWLRYTVDRRGVVMTVRVQLKGYPFWEVLRASAGLVVLVVALLVVVSTVFLRRPNDPAARTMFVVGVALPCVIPEYPLGLQVVDLAGGSGIVGYVGSDLAAAVMWSALLYFAVVFPDRPAVASRVPLALICFAAPFALWVLSWAWALPTAHGDLGRLLVFMTVSTTASRVIPVITIVLLVGSYRRAADADVRRRLRWIAATLAVGCLAYFGLDIVPNAFGSGPLLDLQWLMLLMVPVPLAVAAAILRYRLFDIEVILTRSLLAGSLSAAVVVAYVGVVVVLPRIGSSPSPLLTLLLGSAIAAAAVALRNLISHQVTRLVYGDRHDPHTVVARLNGLNTVAETELVLPNVVRTLAATLRLPYVRLELLAPDGTVEAAAAAGEPADHPTVLSIGDDTATLGRLELGVGSGREPFGPADRSLLDDLAHQITGAARTVLLARALQRSREHLVLAREEERRRLRRDLHDGVGPTLAAQAMQLEVAASLVTKNPAAAGQLIERLGASTHSLIGDVRHIVENLRPAALDQLGLVSAIREYTRDFAGADEVEHPHGFDVEVSAEGDLGDLPAAVEVAAFRIAVEAATNAVRYSRGRRCLIQLHRTGDLHLTITDDGIGLQERINGSGVGLVSMRERAAELGGDCTIATRPEGVGTIVTVRLPARRQERP